jgi:dihydroorotate dehydrogenase
MMLATRLYPLLRPLLFSLDAETAHMITLKALQKLPLYTPPADDPALRVTLWNRNFPNPLGLAAGFDKNAEVIAPMLGFGFGFVEIGTVTPKPQLGNPRPRVFRSPADGAVINRMGFPNLGMAAAKHNIESFLTRKPRLNGILGINIGMNKGQEDPAKDYCLLVRTLGPFADYLTVNISSPNTPGLRNLQDPATFRELIAQIITERDKTCGRDMPAPLLVKLAPDITDAQAEGLAEAIVDLKVDGMILTNTTLDRPDSLPESFRSETGGLSGQPLFEKSTALIRRMYRLTKGTVPIIGAGGISNADQAYEKIRAGASLVQLYSSLAFKGPGIVAEIKSGLLQRMKRDGFTHIQDAVGTGQG